MEVLKLQVGTTQVDLSGAGIVAPVKGCRREHPKDVGKTSSKTDLREEKINVILHGLPAVVDDWLKMIESLFSRVDLGEQATLTIKPAASLQSYESKVISGRLELLGNQTMDLKRGGMGVSLVMLRENIWQGQEVTVPLSNPHGSGVLNGLTVDNQYYLTDGKIHYALISGPDVQGELPAPATVKIKSIDSGNLLANIIISQDVIYNLLPADAWIEGALADSAWNFGAVLNAGASGGQYGLVQWTIPGATELVKYVIDAERAARFAGRLVRPILRMFSEVTTDDYWIRCKVKQGEAIEYTRWQKIKPYKKVQILPAIHIPPKDLRTSEMFGVVFSLEVQRNVSGTHTLTIDDINLMPVDGYRHYDNFGSGGLAYNETLVDELGGDLIYSIAGSVTLRKLTHQAAGKGIWLMPGEDQCLRIKFDTTAGDSPPNQRVSLQLIYRPRRKNL